MAAEASDNSAQVTFFESVKIVAEVTAMYAAASLNVAQRAVVNAAKNGKVAVLICTSAEGTTSYAQVQALASEGFSVSIVSNNTAPGAVKPVTFQVMIPCGCGEGDVPVALAKTADAEPKTRLRREGGNRSGRTKKRRVDTAVLACDAAADATAAATEEGLETAANASADVDQDLATA